MGWVAEAVDFLQEMQCLSLLESVMDDSFLLMVLSQSAVDKSSVTDIE